MDKLLRIGRIAQSVTPVTVTHLTGSDRSRVTTLHLIVHELLALLVAIAMPAPQSVGAGVGVAHRNGPKFRSWQPLVQELQDSRSPMRPPSLPFPARLGARNATFCWRNGRKMPSPPSPHTNLALRYLRYHPLEGKGEIGRLTAAHLIMATTDTPITPPAAPRAWAAAVDTRSET
jgi:hypothetical protein